MFLCLASAPHLCACFFYYMQLPLQNTSSKLPLLLYIPICIVLGWLCQGLLGGRDETLQKLGHWGGLTFFCTLLGWSGQRQQLKALCLPLLCGGSDHPRSHGFYSLPSRMRNTWSSRPQNIPTYLGFSPKSQRPTRFWPLGQSQLIATLEWFSHVYNHGLTKAFLRKAQKHRWHEGKKE